MKYVIIVPDGMGDYPQEELKGRTPVEVARTPNFDKVAGRGKMGTVRTVPDGLKPGSDVANLSLLGYDPKKYYTGRAPFEAASMGIELGPTDWAFRCNLVTVFDEKMAGSFHMALGASLPESGGKNESAIHWDMLCDMRDGGRIWVDDELMYEDGQFVIEF